MASQIPIVPRGYCLTTWNTQGSTAATPDRADAGGPTKAQILADLVANDRRNILFLQEASANQVVLAGYRVFAGQSIGALNNRCTCQILVPAALPAVEVPISNVAGGVLATGGEAGRSPIAVAIDRTLLISIHMTANNSAADTTGLIDALNKVAKINAAYDLIVIGADFNIEPGDLQKSLDATGTARTRAARTFTTLVRNAGRPTQGGANKDMRELDYFVVLTRTDPAFVFQSDPPTLVRVNRSDHNPVQIRCDLAVAGAPVKAATPIRAATPAAPIRKPAVKPPGKPRLPG